METIEKIKQKLYEKYNQAGGSSVDWLEHQALIDTSILYVQKKLAEKDTNTGKAKWNFPADFLLQSIAECIDNGFALDGVNYVLTGNRMYMPTYKAFKNKIYMVYPESEIDVQIVREGDEFKFAKESGSVMYSHQFNNPFEDKPIVGAYCVIKNKRGEFLELLNKRDYDEMQNSSKTPGTWKKWPSEFWRKSVLKRACKTHFNDITNKLEEQDNQLTGLANIVKASDDKKAAIVAAKKKGKTDGDTSDRSQAKQS